MIRAALAPPRIVLGTPSDWTDAEATRGSVAWTVTHALQWNCPVVIVHAWLETQLSTTGMTEDGWSDPTIWEKASARPGAEVAAALRARGIPVSIVTRKDSASHALLEVARPEDMVVLGTRQGRVFRHAFSANVVHRLLHEAPCAVAVVPDGWQPIKVGRGVMVAFDTSERSRAALQWGLTECRLAGSRLVLVRALVPCSLTEADISADAGLLQEIKATAASYGVTDVSLLDVSNAGIGTAHALDNAAADADLLVLGNHRASWLAELTRASVVERTVTIARTPIVVVPDEQPVPAVLRQLSTVFRRAVPLLSTE